MDAPVRFSQPSGVPSEAVAEIRCSHVARKRALSFFPSIKPCPPKAIADAFRLEKQEGLSLIHI